MKGIGDEIPPFVTKNPGIESGYMIAHVTASALASENKTLSHPASVDSMPTSGGQEDLVSMAPWAGYQLLAIQENVINVLAIEMLISCAAHYLCHAKLEPGNGNRCIIKVAQSVLNLSEGDRSLSEEINKLSDMDQIKSRIMGISEDEVLNG